jgi:hypothetical protein
MRLRTLHAGAVLIGLCLTGLQAVAQQPLNVELTSRVWEQFNRGDFAAAIKAADKVLDEFEPQARRDQERLIASKTPVPPTGAPSSAQEKKNIMARGVLNDVGTASYLKGRAAENLKRFDEAKSAYSACRTFRHARTWDPNGWFWDPSQTCDDRLKKLK